MTQKEASKFVNFRLLAVLSWSVSLIAVLCRPCLADTSSAPDVLMIVVDDMNDWISLLDPDSPIKTPNLQRLAQRVGTFTRAYCASPSCNPSRVAALTGLRPSTTVCMAT